MASDLSTTSADAALEAIMAHTTTYYLSFHTADPGTTGASEGTATRMSFTPNAASGGTQTFPSAAGSTTDATGGTYPYFGVWTAATAGTYVGGGALTSTIKPPAGGTITVAAGAFTASF